MFLRAAARTLAVTGRLGISLLPVLASSTLPEFLSSSEIHIESYHW